MSAADAKELALLTQFRAKLQDLNLKGEQLEDKFLLRWIRARDHDLVAAEEMLRKSLKWREENDMDNILSWEGPAEFQTLCPYEFLGFDKENRPVILLPCGSWDIRKIFQLGYKKAFVRFADQLFERILHCMKGKNTPQGNPVTQCCIVIDYDRLSMKTVASFGAVEMLLQSVQRFEANQPETLGKVFAINANYVFTTVFALIKPLLSEKTFGKFFIYNTNVDKWKAALAAQIPKTVLPPKYGGSNTTISDEFVSILNKVKFAPEEEELN